MQQLLQAINIEA